MLVALTLFVLVPAYALTATWDTLQSNDPRSAALAGWTLVTSGDLAFDDGWPPFQISWPAEGRDGRLYSNRFPGVIALAATAYVVPVASGLVPAGPLDEPFQVPVWPATLAAVLVAALAAALTYRLFRQMDVPLGTAVVAGTVVALGSPLWSVSASALWTHGPTHALLVGILLALLKGRATLAAVLAGIAVTFRPHLVVAVLVLAVGQRAWRSRLRVGAGGLAGLLLVSAYSLWIFGQPLPAAGYQVEGLLPSRPMVSPAAMALNVFDWLFNPRRSVLLFVPVVLLAVPGLRGAWRSAPRWVRLAALSGVAYAATQLGLIRASGGTFFFGHRTTIEALVLAAPLLLLAVQRVFVQGSLGRIATGTAVGFSVIVHAFGAWSDMPRETRDVLREEQDRIRSAAFHSAGVLQNPRMEPSRKDVDASGPDRVSGCRYVL